MINRIALLNDLKALLENLQDDLRTRCAERPEIETPLRAQYEAARAAKRTAEAYESWREDQFAQATVAWILSCVFIRFLEDNGLLGDVAYLSGPGLRLTLARDQHTLYFREHPKESDREYLYHVFRSVRGLPGMAPLFDDAHNPVWRLGLSGDGAQLLLEFWQKLNAEEGQDQTHAPLIHDFTDPNLGTRFLGDLYQDLSDEAKKRYALLQTPEFIEEFILDRTLTPAIETFGYQHVRMIDPTCGSAHFLLGGFHRLFSLHQRNHPAVEVRALAQRALDQVFGVDLNPNVVAIARFRLLLAALKVSGVEKLKDAPAFKINVGTGDALLHGPGQSYLPGTMGDVQHHYESEDADLVRHILGQRYHAVVGNPPYITVKDKALNQLYRERFGSCYRKYSLGSPFMEVFFALAAKAEQGLPTQAGFVGLITANSFMRREFGKKLVEKYIRNWDLTHVIDTSWAYIPGHGTSTVILFARNQPPVAPVVRTVMGIKGDSEKPVDAAKGRVWCAILDQVDHPGSQSEFISTADTPREQFNKHPWSIGGGGAAELKEILDESCEKVMGDFVEWRRKKPVIGFGAILGEDEAFEFPIGSPKIRQLDSKFRRLLVDGDEMRDWILGPRQEAIFPYTDAIELRFDKPIQDSLWPLRAILSGRKDFSDRTYEEAGSAFWKYHQIPIERNCCTRMIAFSAVATHNHFVVNEGLKVFKQSCLVAKLPDGNPREAHLELVGLLNSSVGCFWLKQVCQPKGGDHVGTEGARVRTTLWDERYAFDGTKLKQFPVTDEKPLRLTLELDRLAGEMKAAMPLQVVAAANADVRAALENASHRYQETLQRMIAMQEELDWECYRIYELLSESCSIPADQIPPVKLGERAFEIVLARKLAAGELETTWFERHRSKPITELPAHWPEAYRQLVEKRIQLIESDRNIRLIEQPEYKRRWNTEPWEEQQERALREWLLNRLEDARYWTSPELTSCAHLADKVRRDAEFVTVANLYRNRTDYDLTELVVKLVESEAVPFLPMVRYKPSGLRKREVWEQTWTKQREEDAIDARTQLPEGDPNRLSAAEAKALKQQQVGDIPVPPKYETKDFLETTFWRLRGKLDVPKERFIVYPHCNRDADRTPVIGWAGWDHLQQGQAVAGYYERMRTNEGWSDERLLPLLAGVLELLPWLLQWHNTLDPQYGMGMGDFFRSFFEEEARRMGKTLDEIRAWQPPAKTARKKRA